MTIKTSAYSDTNVSIRDACLLAMHMSKWTYGAAMVRFRDCSGGQREHRRTKVVIDK